MSSINLNHKKLFNTYQDFHAQYPDVHLSINHHNSVETIRSVIQGKADVGVVFSFDIPANIDELGKISLGRDNFSVVVGEHHALAMWESVELAHMKDEKLLYMDLLSAELTTHMAIQCGIGETVAKSPLACQNLDTMIMQIRAGLGISLLPTLVAREYASGCRILDITDFDSSYDLTLIWNAKNSNSTLQLFLKICEENLQQIGV